MLTTLALCALLQVDVRETRDVRYYEGEGADERKHRLDVYAPEGASNAPVMMFVHGGAWVSGDKGLYGGLGRAFAREGIVTMCISYRLSPEVQHPEHVRDVARAFKWVHDRAAEYGGDPERIFVSGHSAGGHLVALLATDDRWLAEQELTPAAIRGVIGISGPYTVVGPYFDGVFGESLEGQRDASPSSHVDESQPPFLLLWGDEDMAGLPEMGRLFARRLEEAHSPVRSMEIEGRTHLTILTRMALHEDDPGRVAALEFIRGEGAGGAGDGAGEGTEDEREGGDGGGG